MESGLEGRNNHHSSSHALRSPIPVSMESGLEGRNNAVAAIQVNGRLEVSQWSPA